MFIRRNMRHQRSLIHPCMLHRNRAVAQRWRENFSLIFSFETKRKVSSFRNQRSWMKKENQRRCSHSPHLIFTSVRRTSVQQIAGISKRTKLFHCFNSNWREENFSSSTSIITIRRLRKYCCESVMEDGHDSRASVWELLMVEAGRGRESFYEFSTCKFFALHFISFSRMNLHLHCCPS